MMHGQGARNRHNDRRRKNEKKNSGCAGFVAFIICLFIFSFLCGILIFKN